MSDVVELTVTDGTATTAVQSGRGGEGGSLVDGWTVQRGDQRPLWVAVAAGRGDGYQLTVATVDRDIEAAAHAIDLPAELALDVHLVAPVDVADDVQARDVCRQLVRQVMRGAVPTPPGSRDDRIEWYVSARLLAHMARSRELVAARDR